MSQANSTERSGNVGDAEYQKFVEVGTSSSGLPLEYSTGINTLGYGVTAGGTAIPIKVTDDGNGLGKLDADAE